MAEDLSVLLSRAGWAIETTTAVYSPTENGWRARIVSLTEPGRAYSRWHIAIVDPTGAARYTQIASTIGEAMRLAETQVNGRNAAH